MQTEYIACCAWLKPQGTNISLDIESQIVHPARGRDPTKAYKCIEGEGDKNPKILRSYFMDGPLEALMEQEIKH